MNDFTKDELKDIYEVFDKQGACRLLELKAKIQSLIDNYCEHEICKAIDNDTQDLGQSGIYFKGEV